MRSLKNKNIEIGQVFHNWTVIERTTAPIHIKNKANSFWLCECSCGNKHILTGGHLRASKSKGCRKCSMVQKRKNQGECSFNGLYLRYKHGAISRNLNFDLSKEEFKTITKQNCYYCGVYPKKEHRGKTAYGEYIYNGIDRIDSNKGYFKENCVSCCQICNRAKNNMKFSDFIEWIKQVVEFNTEKK